MIIACGLEIQMSGLDDPRKLSMLPYKRWHRVLMRLRSAAANIHVRM